MNNTAITAGTQCPTCKQGEMVRRNGRRGPFLSCNRFPACRTSMDVTPSREENTSDWKQRAANRVARSGFDFTQMPVAASRITIMPGSDEQEAIWVAMLNGPEHLVVEAVAGSGKTWTMIQGCLRSKLRSIVYLAFNKHNATEAQLKLQASGCRNTTATTYHSWGYRAILNAFPGTQVDAHRVDGILETLRETRTTMLDAQWHSVCSTVRKLVSHAKNLLLANDETLRTSLEAVADHHGIEIVPATYTPAQQADMATAIWQLIPEVLELCKQVTGTIDYDDMPWLPVVLNLPFPACDMLITDEAQDLNPCQQAMAFAACPSGRIVIVGDSNQAIYGFRGADVDSIPNMTKRLEATDRGVKVLSLTYTRRCPASHVALAQALVPQIKALDTAPVGTVSEKSLGLAITEMKPGDLVVSRVNRSVVGVAYSLIRRGVRPIIRGRNIGEGLIALVNKLAGRSNTISIQELAKRLEKYDLNEQNRLGALGRKASNRLAAHKDKIDCLTEMLANVDTLADLRTHLDTLFAEFEPGKEPEAVVLGTVHRTKGLESSRVFIIDPELMPHPMAKEKWEQQQERNLLYVAVTRCKYEPGNAGELVFCGTRPAVLDLPQSAPLL